MSFKMEVTKDMAAQQQAWLRAKHQIRMNASTAGPIAEDVIELAVIFHTLRWKKLPPRAVLYQYLNELTFHHEQNRGPHLELQHSVHHCLHRLHHELNPPSLYAPHASPTPLPVEPELFDSLTSSRPPHVYHHELYALNTRHLEVILTFYLQDEATIATCQQYVTSKCINKAFSKAFKDLPWPASIVTSDRVPQALKGTLLMCRLLQEFELPPELACHQLLGSIAAVISKWSHTYNFLELYSSLSTLWREYDSTVKRGGFLTRVVTEAELVFDVVRPILRPSPLAPMPYQAFVQWATEIFSHLQLGAHVSLQDCLDQGRQLLTHMLPLDTPTTLDQYQRQPQQYTQLAATFGAASGHQQPRGGNAMMLEPAWHLARSPAYQSPTPPEAFRLQRAAT